MSERWYILPVGGPGPRSAGTRGTGHRSPLAVQGPDAAQVQLDVDALTEDLEEAAVAAFVLPPRLDDG